MENDNELLIAATDFFISEVKREFKSAKPEFIQPYLDYFNIWKEGLLQGCEIRSMTTQSHGRKSGDYFGA